MASEALCHALPLGETVSPSGTSAPRMLLSPLRVPSGSRLGLTCLDQPTLKADGLIVGICEEKSAITLSPGLTGIFCSVLSENTITVGTWKTVLSRGDIYVSDAQFQLDLTVATNAACIVIVGTTQAWFAYSLRAGHKLSSTPVPIPTTYRKNNSVCRQLLRLARHCHAANCNSLKNALVSTLMDQVDAMQMQFVEQISRCPGSSMARKRSVFMRLQRARNLIATCANEDLDLAKLALAANYSVGHFITIFRSVFGETPYSSISRQRLMSASSLLRASELAVGEIAQSTGFSSPSSFTRAIRKHLGQSATAFRSAVRKQVCHKNSLGYADTHP